MGQLVLRRKQGQRIVIDPGGMNIIIEVRSIRPGINGGSPDVRIGVTAPIDIAVHREEIALRALGLPEAARP